MLGVVAVGEQGQLRPSVGCNQVYCLVISLGGKLYGNVHGSSQ